MIIIINMIGSSSTLLVKQHGYISLRHLP